MFSAINMIQLIIRSAHVIQNSMSLHLSCCPSSLHCMSSSWCRAMLCNVERRSENELKRQFTRTAWDYVDAVSTISRMENLLEMMHGKKRRLYESMDEQLGMMRPDDQPPEQKRGRQPKEPPTAEQLQRGKKRSMIDDNDMPPVTMTPRNTRQLAGVPHSGMLSTMHGQESTFDSCVESEYSTAWRSHRQWHAHNEAMCSNSLVTLRRNVDSIRHSYTFQCICHRQQLDTQVN